MHRLISEWVEICDDIKQEKVLERLWNNYRNDNQYASDISFEDVVYNLIEVGKQLECAVNIAILDNFVNGKLIDGHEFRFGKEICRHGGKLSKCPVVKIFVDFQNDYSIVAANTIFNCD